jgi:hypothetical protein
MKTLHADLEALMPEPATHRYRTFGHRPRWQLAGKAVPPDAEPLFTADQVREAMQAVQNLAAADTKRLDWIVRQADEFSCSMIVDAPGDGDYIVHGMNGYGQGKTPREAIDNAMRFNGSASIGETK